MLNNTAPLKLPNTLSDSITMPSPPLAIPPSQLYDSHTIPPPCGRDIDDLIRRARAAQPPAPGLRPAQHLNYVPLPGSIISYPPSYHTILLSLGTAPSYVTQWMAPPSYPPPPYQTQLTQTAPPPYQTQLTQIPSCHSQGTPSNTSGLRLQHPGGWMPPAYVHQLSPQYQCQLAELQRQMYGTPGNYFPTQQFIMDGQALPQIAYIGVGGLVHYRPTGVSPSSRHGVLPCVDNILVA